MPPTSSEADYDPDNGQDASSSVRGRESPPARPTEVMGLRFCDFPLNRIADDIVDDAISGRRREVFFVNAHCVNVAVDDDHYRAILKTSPLLYADGAGMALAGRILGRPLHHNVNGTDLLPVLCNRAAQRGVALALLGSKPGIAAACAKALEQAHPGLKVALLQHGYLGEQEELDFVSDLNASDAKILLVAKGVPMQEVWIRRFSEQIDTPVLMGVGALFDFYSGTVRRAPKWMRRARLEWIFRLIQEPRRLFKRYVIGNPLFVARILKMRLRSLSSGTLAD